MNLVKTMKGKMVLALITVFILSVIYFSLPILNIDAIKEGLEISTKSLADAFNGQQHVESLSSYHFLDCTISSEKLISRTTLSITKPIAIGLMISIGIRLHNLSEGLAIAAPIAKGKPLIGKLVMMEMIAGTTAIFGVWIGGFVYSPFAAVVFLSIDARAIFQVVVSIINWIR